MMTPYARNNGLLLPKIIRTIVLSAIVLSFPQFAFAQQPAGDVPISIPVGAQKAGAMAVAPPSNDDQYRIGPGDLVAIQVFNKPQLSREETVDMRGMITMPLINGEIQAACRTDKELAGEIARLYREGQFLKNPQVSVSIKDYQAQPVAVIGAVNSPGRFQLRRRMRLLELLVFHAGGPAPTAGSKVQILSTTPATPCQAVLNPVATKETTTSNADDGIATYDLKDLLQGNNEVNPYVQQGDIINVPAADEVIIVGNVLRPAVVPIVEPITLARAIAMVGGTLPNSKKDKIRITRQTPGSAATTEFLVDLKATDKAKGEGFLLQGGDIVEVSTNTGLRNILRTLSSAIVPMATNLPIRVIP